MVQAASLPIPAGGLGGIASMRFDIASASATFQQMGYTQTVILQ